MVLALCVSIAGAEATKDFLGKPFPDFTVTDSKGKTFTLSEALKDHEAVLINFWATWCDPCKNEFPMLNKVYEEVTVNFCTDTACTPEETDEAGMIAFEGEPREYHVQIVDVPEGYSYDESFDMYTTLAQNADRKKLYEYRDLLR